MSSSISVQQQVPAYITRMPSNYAPVVINSANNNSTPVVINTEVSNPAPQKTNNNKLLKVGGAALALALVGYGIYRYKKSASKVVSNIPAKPVDVQPKPVKTGVDLTDANTRKLLGTSDIVKEQPVIKKQPVVDEPPVVEKKPEVNKPPKADEPPVVEKKPEVNKPPKADEPPVVEKKTEVNEPPKADEPPVVEKKPEVNKPPKADDAQKLSSEVSGENLFEGVDLSAKMKKLEATRVISEITPEKFNSDIDDFIKAIKPDGNFEVGFKEAMLKAKTLEEKSELIASLCEKGLSDGIAQLIKPFEEKLPKNSNNEKINNFVDLVSEILAWE